MDVKKNYSGVWDNQVGFGDRVALILIDFVRAYTTEESPLFAPGVVDAVSNSVELLRVARESQVPIIHTTVKYNRHTFIDAGIWIQKAPVLKCFVETPEYGLQCEGVEPLESELMIVKQYASAFFGTSLAATLTAAKVDTLLIAGCTTSGCIRASAVDSLQNGFRTIVIEECVGDRHTSPHEANLFDINAKYGDVISLDEATVQLSKKIQLNGED